MRALFILFYLLPFLIFSQGDNTSFFTNNNVTPINKTQYFVGVNTNYSSGTTDYTLRAKSIIDSDNLSDLKSYLVFPLDSYNVGGFFRIEKNFAQNKKWSTQFSILTNVNNPASYMIDRDWIDGVEVSSTKSDSEMRNLNINVESDYQVFARNNYKVSIYGQISYDKIEQEIIGYKGWVKDEFGIKYDIAGTEQVIDYDIFYLNSVIGAGVDWSIMKRFNFSLKAGGGLTYAKDYDYHILRDKEGNGKGVGYNIYSSGKLYYSINKKKPEKYKIGLNLNYQFIEVDGKQSMTWIQDEGVVNQKTTLKGIPHKFDYFRSSLGLNFVIML